MMKIVRPICCGMDVHKDIIVATIGITDMKTSITEYIQKTFSSQNYDLELLKKWLKEHNCKEVCMESTGKYWIPIFNVLEDEIDVYLTHPKYTKAIKGKKTDKRDSIWICDIFKHDLLNSSFIPPKEIRALRELCRYRFKLICMRSAERNRYQNAMTVSNIGLASCVSDPFGKTASNIMQEVLASETVDDKKILKLIHKSCKNKEAILKSIQGMRLESDQKLKMTIAKTHMDELDDHIEELEVEIFKRASSMFDSFLHITEIPGIGTFAAIMIISEIGIDMSQFETDMQLCSWAGLAPASNESANKKKSVRISKAGQYLKPLLVQCALAAIKTKNSYFEVKYRNIKKRRGHKKAIIAIARMMLVCIYHMILTGESFNPSDIESFNKPKSQSKQPKIKEEDALNLLKSLGYDLSTIQKTKS